MLAEPERIKMLNIKELKKYYSGKKVLITGHTGFKGSYMCVLLKYLGAKVYGYSLKPVKGELYDLLSKDVKRYAKSKHHDSVGADITRPTSKHLVAGEVFADIRDAKKLTAYVKKVKPDYILHMAAQPLVLTSYEEPAYTYDVNVMGTVNLLDAIRKIYGGSLVAADTIRPHLRARLKSQILKLKQKEPVSILNVTTDKVYENNDLSNYAFKESDKLCGHDPYANSKSCSELVTYSYNKSFFNDKNIFRISTARAGNVIGGGDLNKNRIIPDCFRAIKNKKEMLIRNPKSIRPYQFVLEPLILYLNIMALQKKNKGYEGNYNIGPDKKACLTTDILTKKFFTAWQNLVGANAVGANTDIVGADTIRPTVGANACRALSVSKRAPHEASFLRLDNSLIKKIFNYKEIFGMDKTMMYTAKVYKDMLLKRNIYQSILEIISTL